MVLTMKAGAEHRLHRTEVARQTGRYHLAQTESQASRPTLPLYDPGNLTDQALLVTAVIIPPH